jgi:precorrin-6A/cobalt-precorrin-6A reductase
VLILGGTREARSLASELLAKGFEAITSLAGVTDNPVLPAGKIRRGGFGGVEGLAAYLKDEVIAAVADATHPFAAQISRHAVDAARQNGIPLLRLERRAWQAQPGDLWTAVANIEEAVAALPAKAHALVTIGRKEIGAFFARTDIGGVARMIEAPDASLPQGWSLILERPPFTVRRETVLMTERGISHLVAKNAGGAETQAKILAARHLRLPVIMIARPPKPDCEIHATPEELARALAAKLLP